VPFVGRLSSFGGSKWIKTVGKTNYLGPWIVSFVERSVWGEPEWVQHSRVPKMSVSAMLNVCVLLGPPMVRGQFLCGHVSRAPCCNLKVVSLSLTKTTSFFLNRYCMHADNVKVVSSSLTALKHSTSLHQVSPTVPCILLGILSQRVHYWRFSCNQLHVEATMN